MTLAVAHAALDAAGEPARRDRDHEPARDRRGLGPAQRRAVSPRDRVAGPPHGRALRRAAGSRPRAALSGARAWWWTPTSGTKIEWLIRHGGVPAGAAFGTIDSWLAFKLTGEHVTDYSNASRTLLFDIRERAWDAELCELLGVDAGSLPEPLPSAHVYGHTGARRAGAGGRHRRRPAGRALRPGVPRARPRKNTYGTRSFVLVNAGRRALAPPRPAHDHRVWVDGRVDYALEAIFATGATVQWLRDGLGIIGAAAETGSGEVARRKRRRLPRAGFHRPRLAALGSLRARRSRVSRGAVAGPTSRARPSSRSHTRPWTRCVRWSRPPALRSTS